MDEESDSEEVDEIENEILTANENPINEEIKIETESLNANSESNATKSNKKVEATNETEQLESLKPIICSVCNQEFESRNKLFEHIKEEGHAAPKTINKKVPNANAKVDKKNKKSKK